MSMTMKNTGRTGLLTAAGIILAVIAMPIVASQPASAQAEDCKPLVKMMQERGVLLQRLNAMNAKKQKDPAQFCAVFQQLSAKLSETIPEIERNGSWCHVPDAVLPGLKAEQPKIAQARTQACKVAAEQKKMQEAARSQQQRGPGLLGGGDGIVGGPVRMPSGAL
jgi:hypothetical protein